ncbi:MAG: DUF411 domain-containing protein [Gammaproteobacteria bacterium]|nr:DUF411 domain-containing protein [Gammaproteobacteria bacterium]
MKFFTFKHADGSVSRIALATITFVALFGLALLVSALKSEPAHAVADIKVYKNPSCGCCGKWVEHLEAAGLVADVEAVNDVTPLKTQFGVPTTLASCHTAKIGGYFIEGHVPVEDIKRLLAEKPDIAGLAVPGMPMGSPGMEIPGRAPVAYKVFAVDRSGSTSVFSQH